MLQTPAIKPDSSVTPPSIKEKDPPAPSLDANFSSYFNQMMAALPAPLMDAAGAAPSAPAPAAAPRASAPPRKSGQDHNPVPAAASEADGSQGTLAAAATLAAAPSQTDQPTQTQDDARASSPDPQGRPASGNEAGGPAVAAAAATAGGVAAPSLTKGPLGAQTSAPAQPQQAAAPPAPSAPPGPPTPPATPEAADASKARTALDQAYPGGRFQMQFGDDAVPATTKAPLTEFMNQIQLEPKGIDPAFQSASLPTETLAPPPVGAPAVSAVSALPATAALPAALVAGSSAMAGLPAAKEGPGAGAVPGNLAPAMAVGAGAATGAFGAVRVTAAQTADPPMAARQQNPMSQVDGTIRWLVKNQDKGAELQLHPESLGRVQIKLKVEGNVVHAKLWASEAAAVPIMQQHRAFLEDSLRSQGLVLGSFDLQHGRREDQPPTPSSNESAAAISGTQDRPKAGQETPMLPAAAAPRGNRIEYVA